MILLTQSVAVEDYANERRWIYKNCDYRDVNTNEKLGTLIGTVIKGVGGTLQTVMKNHVVRLTTGWHYTPLTNANRDPEYHFNMVVKGTGGKADVEHHVYTNGHSGTLTFHDKEPVYMKQNAQLHFEALEPTPAQK